jgi:hypothetical protein
MNEQAYQALPNIVTEQIVIETKTSARMIPVTAEKKGIDEINRALETAKKEHELLGLYHQLLKYIGRIGYSVKRLRKKKARTGSAIDPDYMPVFLSYSALPTPLIVLGLYNASTYCDKETLKDLKQKVKTAQKEIKQKEKELEELE